MTKEDWAIAEKQALQGYKGCKLLIDGYDVCLIMTPKTAYKNSIAVFISGKFKGGWLLEDCEERRRFCCPKKKKIRKSKDTTAYLKKASKKEIARYNELSTYTYYWPYWNNFKSLKSHLIKNNTSIELVNNEECDYE